MTVEGSGGVTSDQRPIAYASTRKWCWPAPAEVSLDALQRAWNQSRQTIEAIRRALERTTLPACVRSVAVSGSLGRMEYTAHSDVDLIMIAQPATDQATRSTAGRAVWEVLAPLELRPPLMDGIFSAPIDESLLISRDSLGVVSEPKAVFGTRMQLLLDSQPVSGESHYDLLLERILHRYQPDQTVASHWSALLDDLIRYHRSLRAVYRWTRREDPAAWRSRDIKMTHSRLLMYAGLLFLLGDSSHRDSHWLASQLRRTPLERVATAMDDGKQRQCVMEILRRYDRFLSVLDRPDFPELIARHDDHPAALHSNELYRAMKSSGEALSDELYTLLLQRSPRWSAEFRKKIVFGC